MLWPLYVTSKHSSRSSCADPFSKSLKCGCVCLWNVITGSAGAWKLWTEPVQRTELRTGHMAVPGIIGGVSWTALWAGMAFCNKIHSCCLHKRTGEAVKAGEVKVISFVYTLSGCSTNAYNSHGNQLELPVSSGAGNRAVREELGAYFYLISFIPVWKQALLHYVLRTL